MAADDQFIRGAGMLAVLKVLEDGELYGYAIVEALGRTKGEALHLGQSTVYPMLYNLEAKGLVKSRWDDSGARPRKYYSLTKAGKARLAEDTDQWREITKAMASLGLAKLGLAKLGLARLAAIQAACVHRKFPVVVPNFPIALLLIGLAISASLLGEQRAFAKLTQSHSNGGTDTTQATSDPSAALYERLQAFDALASAESRDIYLQTGIADDAMTRWLEATRAIGPELVAAARNSTARALDLQQGYDLLLPHLSQQRRLVHVMRLLTHDAVARGDSALATDLVGAQVASVRGLGEDHVLVSSLVSIATLRTSLATVTDLIDRASLDSAAAKSIASARDGLGALMQQQLRDAFRTESEFPLQELGRLSALDDAGWNSRMEQWGLTEVEGIDRTNLEAMQDGAVRFRDALNAAVGTEDTKSMGLALQSLEERLHAGDFGPMLKALGPASLRVSVERLESALAQLAEQDAVLEALATGAKQPMELANAARHYLAASRAVLALDADTQRLVDALRVAPESLDEADRRTARRAIEALRTSVMDQMLRATSITRCEFDDAAQPEPDLLPEGCEGALGAFRLMLFDPLIPGERPESAAKLADVCVAALTAARHFAEGGGIGRALIAQHMLRDLTFVLTQPEVARQIDAQVRARFEAQLARFNTQDPLGFQRAIDFERGRIASIGSTPRSTPKGERTAGTPFGRERLARLSPESICFLVATLTSQRPALQQARCTCSFDGPMLDVRGFFDLTALEKAQQQAETLRTRFEAIVLEGSDDNAPAIRSLSVTRPVDLAARHSDALAEVERLRAIASPRTNN